MPKTPTVLRINAKCSDCFSAVLDDGKTQREYIGYVPNFMPGKHYGDYVELEIDIATGQILNWKKPTQDQLGEIFSEKDE